MVAGVSLVMRGAVLAVAIALAGCSSVSDGGLSPGNLVAGGKDPAAEQKALQEFAVVAVCPKVQVRDGTQDMRVYERGKEGDLAAIRFQATIGQYARECHTDPMSGVTTVKVGVAGRMLAGPSGATGSASLPLRVVLLRNGDEVLYSQLIPLEATIAPGTAATDWHRIVEGITVPADKTNGAFVIYVGFDETGGGKAGRKARS